MLDLPVVPGGGGPVVLTGTFPSLQNPPSFHGAFDLDGVNTYTSLMSLSGSTYEIDSICPIFASTFVVQAGITLQTRNTPIYATSITINGTVLTSAETSVYPAVAGQSGINGTNQGWTGSTWGDTGYGLLGGFGGEGGGSTTGNLVLNNISDPTQIYVRRNVGLMWVPTQFVSGAHLYGWYVGGGGSGGCGTALATGGRGGNGGGMIYMIAPTITIGAAGVVSANGYDGDAGTSAGGGASGGGGGGGGGVVYLEYTTLTNSGSITVAGGSGGAAGGVGATAGTDGEDGYIFQVQR